MIARLACFDEVWAADFEFTALEGEQPVPICLVARELHSGREVRLFEDELKRRRGPPFRTDTGSVFVAYYAPAEMACYLALDWLVPERILDLFAEFRVAVNGIPSGGASLLAALNWYGEDSMDATEKDAMGQLALRGGPYTPTEAEALLQYCAADVSAVARLLDHMLPTIDLPRALLRGRYAVAVARMEAKGVPLDTESLSVIQREWTAIRTRLIEEVNVEYSVFEDGRSISQSSSLGYVNADSPGRRPRPVDHALTWTRSKT